MKRFYFLLLTSMMAMMVSAEPTVSLRYMTEYSYNLSYGHYANFDLGVRYSPNEHFELDGTLQASTADFYTGSVNTRALFPLSVGALYLENRLLYKYINRNDMYDFDVALALGYRMDYVNVEVGYFSRFMDEVKGPWHSEDDATIEPYNLLYRIEAFIRPQSSNWNMSFCFSNIDEFQMERMWQPLFMIGGRYSPTEHWDILLEAQCKPTGMFHLNAQFYGATARAGFAYRF